MAKPFITISNLSKQFRMGETLIHALDGVSLDVPPKSFCVVMGPSGSGKSTLLNLVGGLDRPSSGRILVDDQQLEEMDENMLARFRRFSVGFIFQSFNLIQSMNAIENVGFPMQFAGIPPRERKSRSQELLSQVGLLERGGHKPGELSGGEQQRVAAARALVNNPKLILADEPTGNLDRLSGAGIMQLLSDLHKAGRTVLVVTHDPRMMQYATQKVFLMDGKVVDEKEYNHASLG
jgi:putative ABC transport system ATP-binding protein